MHEIKLSALLVPAGILLLLIIMLVRLPPLLLDVLLAFNLALSIVVMAVVLQVGKPLNLSIFPSLLLLTTLLRLALNLASSRLVLLEGHTGTQAAGRVIEAFGQILTRGNEAVGLIIFLIVVMVNFMVITKGAGRIAEVSARFILDSLPGKQTAIDAELKAGHINDGQAHSQREDLAAQTDFYGAMDGAAKFVRGDAIAGVLIVGINLLGGLIIGTIKHDLDLATAAHYYLLLTIGDGLVTQIPALLISTSAAILASRTSREENFPRELTRQLFNANTNAVKIAALVLALLAFAPGMPAGIFLFTAAALALVAGKTQRHYEKKPPSPVLQEVGWSDLPITPVLSVELGFSLLYLLQEPQQQEFLRRLTNLRLNFTKRQGYLAPPVVLRDNMSVPAQSYRVLLRGVCMHEGLIKPHQCLKLGSAHAAEHGEQEQWVSAEEALSARQKGFIVMDAPSIILNHLNQMMMAHASELLNREAVLALLEHSVGSHKRQELSPGLLPISTVHKVMQNLLEENIPLTDVPTIVDALLEHASHTTDPQQLTDCVRVKLSRFIMGQLGNSRDPLEVFILPTSVEKNLAGSNAALSPDVVHALTQTLWSKMATTRRQGKPALLLTSQNIRRPLTRLLRRTLPQLTILAHEEIPEGQNIRILDEINPLATPTS